MMAPSGYGRGDVGEDLAETGYIYFASLGLPVHEEYRAIFPARFRHLDSVFGD